MAALEEKRISAKDFNNVMLLFTRSLWCFYRDFEVYALKVSNMSRLPRIFLLFLLLTLRSHAADLTEPQRILFIGNSYTGYNNLPRLVGEIISSNGNEKPQIKSSNPGGRTLENHLSIRETLTLIDEGNWDLVVLQGHSMEAAMSEINEVTRKSFLNSGRAFAERIRKSSPKARIVFYQTWARHADYWKDPKADRSIGNSPNEMSERVRTWYDKQQEQCANSFVAPVGQAWTLFYQAHPKQAKALHIADNSHPSYQGSYLAALVIAHSLNALDGKKPIGFHGKLTEQQANDLKAIAKKACAAPALKN